MRKGFITFTDANFLPLTEILVQSVLDNTHLEIEVVLINTSWTHASERVITKPFWLKKHDFYNICYTKIWSAFNTSFDKGLQCDADMIVAPGVEKLFDEIELDYPYVKGALHPQDPLDQQDMMDFLGIRKKTQPYIHATYLVTQKSKSFLEDYYRLIVLADKHCNFNDETFINCCLWREGVTDGWVDCFDPFCVYFFSPIDIKANYKDMIVNRYICHGEKSISNAKEILRRIKIEL